MEVSFKSRKLKDSIRRVTDKAKNQDLDLRGLSVYGVSKESGVAITGKAVGKNLGEYYYFSGQKIAYNPYRANIGSIGLTESDFKGLMSPAYVIFEVDNTIYPNFLLLYLKSTIGQGLIKWYGDRGGIRSSLRISDLGKIDFPDISYEDQKKIYDDYYIKKLKIDELVKELNYQEELLSSLEKKVLQEAISGELTRNWREINNYKQTAKELIEQINQRRECLLKKGEIKIEKSLPPISHKDVPFKIPDNWVWCRMQDLCPNISSGSTPSKSEFVDDGIPYLKVYNIRNQNIDLKYMPQFINEYCHTTKLKRSILKPGDVVMNIVGPPLGKIAIIPEEFEEWNCNQAIAFFKPIIFNLNKWIYTFLLSGDFLKRIELVGTAGQDNISIAKCKNIEIPLPPENEQKVIVNRIERLMKSCEDYRNVIRQNKIHTDEILQSYFFNFLGGVENLFYDSTFDSQTVSQSNISREKKYYNHTIFMELIDLLKEHGKLHAEDLWKMSKHYDNKNIDESIDKFYADLKEKVEIEKTIKEVANEKGYLELT